MKAEDALRVSVEVTNTGARPGKEVVQLYVADKESTVIRPEKELREFAIMIGKSSRDIVLQEDVFVEQSAALPVHYTKDSTLGDVMEDPRAAELVKGLLSPDMFGGGESGGSAAEEAISGEMMEAMMRYMPLRGILSFAGNGSMGMEGVEKLIEELNKNEKA